MYSTHTHRHTHTYLKPSALTLQLIAPLNLTTPFLSLWSSGLGCPFFLAQCSAHTLITDWDLYTDSIWINSLLNLVLLKHQLLCVWKLLLPLWHVSPHDFVNKDKSWLWDGTFHTQISPQHNTSAGWVHFSQPVIKQILCWRLKIKLSQ